MIRNQLSIKTQLPIFAIVAVLLLVIFNFGAPAYSASKRVPVEINKTRVERYSVTIPEPLAILGFKAQVALHFDAFNFNLHTEKVSAFFLSVSTYLRNPFYKTLSSLSP